MKGLLININQTCALKSLCVLLLLWFRGGHLAEPLVVKIVLELDLGSKVVSVDIFNLAMYKLILSNVNLVVQTICELRDPGGFTTLCAECTMANTYAENWETTSKSLIIDSNRNSQASDGRLASRLSKVHPQSSVEYDSSTGK